MKGETMVTQDAVLVAWQGHMTSNSSKASSRSMQQEAQGQTPAHMRARISG